MDAASAQRLVRSSTCAVWRHAVTLYPDGAAADIDGVFAFATGIPVQQWNGAYVVAGPRRPVETFAAVRRWHEDRGLGHGLLVPVELVPALAAACGEAKLRLVTVQPAMVLEAAGFAPATPPHGLRVTRAGPAHLEVVARIQAEAFGDDLERAGEYVAPQLADDRYRYFLGLAGDEPVSVAAAIATTTGAACIDGVATAVDARRRGYGAAVTSAAVAAAFDAGAVAAYLNPSDAGLGTYRRLGFTPVDGLAIWTPRPE